MPFAGIFGLFVDLVLHAVIAAAGGYCDFIDSSLIIGKALKTIRVDLFALLFKLFSFFHQQPVNAFLTAFVMGRGVHHNGEVWLAVKVNGRFIAAVLCRRTLQRGRRLVQLAKISPIVGGNSVGDRPPTLFVGSRQPGDKFHVVVLGLLKNVGSDKG